MGKLDTTIIKCYHETEEDFLKIKPHLKKFDVLSIESACLAEKMAQSLEDTIQGAYKLRIDYDSLATALGSKSGNPDFYTSLYQYIFPLNIPVIFAERYEKSDAERMRRTWKQIEGNLVFETSDHVSKVARTIWEKAKKTSDYLAMRDKNIAINTGRKVLRRIRKLYPEIERVKYGIIIGLGHFPEKHMRKVNVIDCPIDYEREDATGLLEAIYREGGTLADGAKHVAKVYLKGIMPMIWELDDEVALLDEGLLGLETTMGELEEFSTRLSGLKFKKDFAKEIITYLLEHGVKEICGSNLEEEVKAF